MPVGKRTKTMGTLKIMDSIGNQRPVAEALNDRVSSGELEMKILKQIDNAHWTRSRCTDKWGENYWDGVIAQLQRSLKRIRDVRFA